MGRKRVTHHNGRIRKGGEPFSPEHNDRNFDVSKADNIDPARTALNRYWAIGSDTWYGPDDGKPSFADVERAYYEKHFMAMYEASKERSRKRGQLKRVKPFEDWRKARQFVPEETYLQIGSVEDGTVNIKKFKACAGDYMKALNAWNAAHGKPFTILDAAYHFDEAIPQLHMRRVWHSKNPETGIDEIGQEKALERAGVRLPDPSKPPGPKNNRKMTFDKEIREILLDICEKRGVEIERIPEPGRKHNQSKEQWITEKQKAREKALDEREKALDEREKAIKERETAANKAYSDTYFATTELERKKATLESEIEDIAEFRSWKAAKAAREAQEARERERQEQEAKAAQDARERERREQESRRVALEAQSPSEPEPPKKESGGLLLAALRSRTQAAAARDASQSDIEYPGL